MFKPRQILAELALAIALVVAVVSPASAQSMRDGVNRIRSGWEHITYEVHGSSTQTRQLDRLADEAAALVARYPGQAEPLLWQGIVVSEQANRANFLHQLGLARQARDILARAYAIDPSAAKGGVAMSLAVLYYKVPGSPIGFGDDERAGRLLRQALQLDPDGLDANYFYGDYLHDQGKDAEAAQYLRKALAAPHDASRPVWDAGRRREVQALLDKVS
jgi:tetratricopeptide (TPR) repeat protein